MTTLNLSSLTRRCWRVALLLIAVSVSAVPATAESIWGVSTTNGLFSFDSATPGTTSGVVPIAGLQAGELVLGIDFRPASGVLYALGSTSRLYTLNTTTGAATLVGAAGAFVLSGTDFGFDFNPTVDRIRVTSDTGQNIRLNPNDGALITDAPLNGGATGIVGSAYSNNVNGAATTTLYGIDSTSDSLYIQTNPNAGLLTLVGPLGFNTGNLVGFDISGLSGNAYASLTSFAGGGSQFFTINLATGAVTLVGSIGSPIVVRGISATAAPAAVPEPATLVLISTGLAGVLLRARRRTRGSVVGSRETENELGR